MLPLGQDLVEADGGTNRWNDGRWAYLAWTDCEAYVERDAYGKLVRVESNHGAIAACYGGRCLNMVIEGDWHGPDLGLPFVDDEGNACETRRGFMASRACLARYRRGEQMAKVDPRRMYFWFSIVCFSIAAACMAVLIRGI